MDENMEWNNEIEEVEELIKPTEESKMSWMMKKGWNIGKKVMITGATISSAPIVLPPLMIYSTIGLAFSLPFGFVLGTYACTEKLMSKLLWRPEFEEQDQELVLKEEEMGDSAGSGGNYSFGEGKILGNVYCVSDIEEEIEGDNLSEMSAEECPEGLCVGEIVAKGIAEENVDERILVKDIAGDEKKPVYEMHPFGGDISSELNFDDVAQEENYVVIEEGNRSMDDNRVVEEERGDNEENVDSLVSNEEPLMAEKLDDNEKAKAISAAEGVIVTSGDGQIVNEHKEEMPIEEAEGIRFEGDANQRCIVNGSSVEKQRLSKTLGEQIADFVVQPVSSELADRGSVEEASLKKKTILPSEQVFYSEENIWKQIGTLRKIVGYQAVMQTTCVEELKALYVFTGVEPPFAFKDPADLEEINDKLRLLMLIVGVK